MKTDGNKPRREFPFVVIAEYGMAARNSAIFCKTIGGLDKDALVHNGEQCVRATSIMGLLTLAFACGVRGTIEFSRPVHPDELWGLPGLHEVIEIKW